MMKITNFKKILAAVGMISVAGVATLSVVACGNEEASKPKLADMIKKVIEHKDDEKSEEFIKAYNDYLAFKVQEIKDRNGEHPLWTYENGEYPFAMTQGLRNHLAAEINKDEKANEGFPTKYIVLKVNDKKIEINKEKQTFTISKEINAKIMVYNNEELSTSISGTFKYVIRDL